MANKIIQLKDGNDNLYPTMPSTYSNGTLDSTNTSGGWVRYQNIGQITVLSAQITCVGTLTANKVLAINIPRPMGGYTFPTVAYDSYHNTYANIRITAASDDGQILTGDTLQSGATLRFSIVYLHN